VWVKVVEDFKSGCRLRVGIVLYVLLFFFSGKAMVIGSSLVEEEIHSASAVSYFLDFLRK